MIEYKFIQEEALYKLADRVNVWSEKGWELVTISSFYSALYPHYIAVLKHENPS